MSGFTSKRRIADSRFMRQNFVRCTCGEKHDAAAIEILNVEEEFATGADVVTFVCPATGEQAVSNVYRGA